jgi:HPt (histidine-containing phosphotransfer) domain-containing protein
MSGSSATDHFSDVPAVDAAALDRLERIGGKRLLKGMIEIFLREVPGKVTAIESAIATGDLEAARQNAQAMKSMVSNLGASALQALTVEIEAAAAARDQSRATELAKRLPRLFAAARELLQQHVD